VSAVLKERRVLAGRLPLSDLVDFNPKPPRGSMADDLAVSFVPMAAVEAGSGWMDATQVRPYGEVKKGFTYFCDGDVLFAKITPCMENGKMAVARGLRNGVGFGSTEFHVLRPREGLEAKYLYHFISSCAFRGEASHHMTGAVGQKRVPLAFLQQSEIPLPSVEKQRSILAEIEKQFSRLDEAVASLQRVAANARRYAARVLEDAASGRILFASAKVPKQMKRLGALIDSLDQGWSPQCDSEPGVDDEWAVMKTTAIQPMLFRSAENKRLGSTLAPRVHLELVPGDLLITRAGPRSRVGVCSLVRSTRSKLMLCDKAYRLRVDTHWARPEYLEVILNAPSLLEQIETLKTGISDSGLNLTQKKLLELLIPTPPVDEQRRIVAEVDRRLSIVREVEAEVEANLKRAQALRQAILARAFSAN
jgi:type I restriction enzyme, S subunit